jgi:transcriptional regulator with XRE-family HTH domain
MRRSKPSGSDRFASAFGEALDKQLAARAMRRVDLAAAMDVSQSYVSKVANGTGNASPRTVARFAGALNLNAAETSSLMAAAAQAKGKRWGGSPAGCFLKVSPEQFEAIHRFAQEGKKISHIVRIAGLC